MLRERASNPAMGSAQGTTGAGAAGVYVEGLSRYKVQSSEDLAELLNRLVVFITAGFTRLQRVRLFFSLDSFECDCIRE